MCCVEAPSKRWFQIFPDFSVKFRHEKQIIIIILEKLNIGNKPSGNVIFFQKSQIWREFI